MNCVYFDESGNTGQNLLDVADPVFVLSSCRFTPEEETRLIGHFAGIQGAELKFSRLRKTGAGQRAVLKFLQASEVNASSAAMYIVNKPFMVVTKYCDIVVEPTFRNAGLDFYAKGLNIATANLLALVMPTYLGQGMWNTFLAAFVRMIRERSFAAFTDFRTVAELAYSHLEHTQPEMAPHVGAALLLRPDELLPMVSDSELDPLVPAYHLLVNHWGRQLGERFEMVVDQSKVLAKQEALLRKLSRQDLRPFCAGYDRRTVEFPLKVADIKMADSRVERQVQFADLLAGALARAANSSAVAVEGSFENVIAKVIDSKRLMVGSCCLVRQVDPVELDTNQDPLPGQIGLAEYATMIAREDPRTKAD